MPDHTFTECFDEERDPFFWRLTDMSTRVADGRYRLADGPGFGDRPRLGLRAGTHRGHPGQHQVGEGTAKAARGHAVRFQLGYLRKYATILYREAMPPTSAATPEPQRWARTHGAST